ncbi:serine hydrolase [Microbulbifer salipaludis]|uniref:Serine hydrolase n=1 Tax=Microbulbifer salipaludis TaxID=187980 RepID=A0ABS3E5A6_9GAMM|nr:serine hydrolase domain-containing protein [Microbulbifer salipaludis]MBN8430393.1 serine hydrolase [Microbulbifer salipaludis]
MISFLFYSLVSTGAAPSVLPAELDYFDPAQRSHALGPLIESLGEGSDFQELHSFLVYRHGKVVAEQYYSGNADYIDFPGGLERIAIADRKQWSASDPHYVASVNKSVTALLTGIWLSEQGRTTKQTLAPLLPEYQAYFSGSKKSALSVHHILSMQTGFSWDEWDGDDLVQLWRSNDFASFLLSQENSGPGREWRYNSAALNLLFEAIQGTLPIPLDEWATRRLYHPMGITDFEWGRQPNGVAEASARLFLLPRDMLKLGVLILQEGYWEGKQLVPSLWIRQMCSVQAEGPAGFYGYGIWLREINGIPVCTAEGDGGQYIHVIAEKELVVVMTQGNYLQWPLYREQSDTILRRLLEALEGPAPDS